MTTKVRTLISVVVVGVIVILIGLLANQAKAQTLTILASFNGANGGSVYPSGGLILSGSTLYGTTYWGGTSGSGTVFSLPLAGGTPTTLASFNGTNGYCLPGSLILSGSTLYGVTSNGGISGQSSDGYTGYGTVFSLPISGGTPTTLV